MTNIIKFIKKYKIYVIFSLIIIVICGYYFYQRSFGYFVPVTLSDIASENIGLTSIYKTGDFYTIIDNDNNIYRVNIESDLKIKLIDKNTIEQVAYKGKTDILKSGTNTISYRVDYDKLKNIQLNNDNILFYHVNKEGKLYLFVYDPIKNQIANKYEGGNNQKSYDYGVYVNVIDNDCVLITTKNKLSNGQIIEKYNSNNNILTPINMDKYKNKDIFPFVDNVQLTDNKSLFIKFVEGEQNRIFTYIYDSKQNKFYEVNTINLIAKELVEPFEIKVIPLKTGHFLLAEHGYNKHELKREDVITKYEYKNNQVQRIDSLGTGKTFSGGYLFTNYTCTGADILPLNDNELLVTGGMAGCLIGYGQTSRAYLFNLKSKKIRRLSNMKKARSKQSSILIDEKSAIIFNGDSILNLKTELEGFKRWIIW